MLALVLSLGLVLGARAAWAHAIGLSTGEYTARGSTLVAKMAFARNEVAQLAPQIDKNRDGHITAAEVSDARPLLTEKILRRIRVSQAGADCPAAIDDAGLTEQDGLLIGGHWSCGASDQPFQVELLVLDDLARGHRHVARAISGETTSDTVQFGDQRSFEVAAAPPGKDAGPATPAREARPGFGSFFGMGVEHILTGYDHLLFLFGLVLLASRLRSILTTITAFTLAHSVTLAVAALGIWTPSPRIVEPVIALSIAYVGLDNLSLGPRWRPKPDKRWHITFPFGLVHGFGFASALKEVGFAGTSVTSALVAFNLGVESGQLAVLSIVLPTMMWLRKKAWLADREAAIVRWVSLAIIVVGVVWCIARVVTPG